MTREVGAQVNVAPNICESSVCNLLYITFWRPDFDMAPGFLKKKLFAPNLRCKVSHCQQHRTVCNKHDPDSGQSPVFLWYTTKAVRELSVQTVICRRQLRNTTYLVTAPQTQ
jgi:hypothetical protein